MNLQLKLQEELKVALKAGDTVRRDTLRLLLSAIHYAEIEKGQPPADPDILGLLSREASKRRESIEAFTKGHRPDLVSREEAELKVILGYLPQPLSREEIFQAARKVIAEVGAQGPRDMGRVMKVLMPQLQGRAEGREVSAIVSELLSSKKE